MNESGSSPRPLHSHCSLDAGLLCAPIALCLENRTLSVLNVLCMDLMKRLLLKVQLDQLDVRGSPSTIIREPLIP